MKKLCLVVLASILVFNLNAQNNNTLIRGQALKANSKLVSDNEDYYLLMQADGNLCIYGFDERIYWCTMSQNSKGGGELKLQEDGNLVVKNKENGAEWTSKTHPYFDSKFQLLKGNKPTKLVLENNGTLALYNKRGKEVWSVNVGAQKTNTQTNNLSLNQNDISRNKKTQTTKPSLKTDNESHNNFSSVDSITIILKNHRAGGIGYNSNAIHWDSIFPINKAGTKTPYTGFVILREEYMVFSKAVDAAAMGNVVNGIREGIWTQHGFEQRSDGSYTYLQKIGEVFYLNGKESHPDGLETLWYNSTKKKDEGIYLNGKKNGLWTHWTAYRGKYYLSSKKNFVSDKVESAVIYNAYGKKVNELNFIKYNPEKDYTTEELEYPHDYEGKQIEYLDNGKKYLETNYANGKKEGISTKYYDSVYNWHGVLGINIPHNEQDHGKYPIAETTHYKLTETNYVNGNKIFMHIFDKDGNIVKIENYD